MESNNSFKILIVDDNPYNRQLISAFIEAEGFNVIEASNGKDAIEKVNKDNFKIIFMDLLMPKMDGFEATSKLRKMGYKGAIIAVSALNLSQDRQRSFDSGCDEFLPKPILRQDLKLILNKYSKITDSHQQKIEATKQISKKYDSNKLLLVEEDEIIREYYKNFFLSLGFNVIEIEKGSSAWEKIKGKNADFDIVVTNVFTSDIDGLGLLTIIKREYPNILVFIYTESFDQDIFQMAVQQGVDGIIPHTKLEISFVEMLDSAIFQAQNKGLKTQFAASAKQIRKVQSQLIDFGCENKKCLCDIAHSSIYDAGGDIVRCKLFNLEGRCGIILADVAGHDVMSSYMSAIFLGILMSLWDSNSDPKNLLKAINTELIKLGYNNSHICLTSVLWDKIRGRLKIASAGNPECILISFKDNGTYTLEAVTGGGMCLGLLENDELFSYDEIEFNQNQALIVFSDGFESEDLLNLLLSGAIKVSQDKIEGLPQNIMDEFVKKYGQKDDMIIFAISGKKIGNENKLNYSFNSDFSEVDKACEWLSSQLTSSIIPDGKDVDFILFAVREALLNSVEHGNKHNKDSYVDISVYPDKEKLVINISDEGKGFDLGKNIEYSKTQDGFQIGKRGLALIDSVADKISLYGGTLTLTFLSKK
ncbi:MAG: response regulator [Desulfobacterales bacterium]|nr:response regulator [Desulfobacterales bacterium]